MESCHWQVIDIDHESSKSENRMNLNRSSPTSPASIRLAMTWAQPLWRQSQLLGHKPSGSIHCPASDARLHPPPSWGMQKHVASPSYSLLRIQSGSCSSPVPRSRSGLMKEAWLEMCNDKPWLNWNLQDSKKIIMERFSKTTKCDLDLIEPGYFLKGTIFPH